MSVKQSSSGKKTKKESNVTSDNFKSDPKRKSIKGNTLPFYKDVVFRQIVGIILILISLFLIAAIISYFVSYKADLDKVTQPNTQLLFNSKAKIVNKMGPLGALVAHNMVFGGFGVLAFLLVLLIGGLGYNILSKQRKFSFTQYLKYATPALLLLSPVLAYLSIDSSFPFGGYYGTMIVQALSNVVGYIGTGLLLFTALLISVIALFKPNFRAISLPNIQLPTNTDKPENTDKSDTSFTSEANLEIHSTLHTKQETTPEVISVNEQKLPEVPSTTNEIVLETPIEPEQVSVELEEENTITQELDINIPVALESNKNNQAELEMDIVVKPAEAPIISDVKSSIEGTEPYDPALDLSNYKFPTIDLLEDRGAETISVTKDELEQNKNQIIQTLKNFGIGISKISATVGPTVTLYEIVPAEGVRISKIRNLEDDIALSLAALGIRIIAPIPGKGTIGIEVPNLKKQIVNMRSLIASDKFINNNYSLPIALGKRIDNENYIVDLATMPHMLMAGATGQGKSVGLNAILVSLLYKKHPSQLKFVLVDPKKVELSVYRLIERHFLAKLPNEEESIITDTKKVINTLNALCIEMDQRYDLLKEAGVRNIKEYNEKFIKRSLNPQKGHRYLPFIVLVVDEFADLIMTAGKEVEMPIARLAQLARAIGIHLIIATQRPSVNVITGTIKANFPARIAFRVSAKVDSRTILDAGGAEQLVGRGDMLINTGNELTRVQCAFVDTPEVEAIVDFIGEQAGYPSAYELPEYVGADADFEVSGTKQLSDIDNMFEQAARLVVSSQSGSTSMLQRWFNLGYNRAGLIMYQMESVGIVGPGSGGKPREVLVKTEVELEEFLIRLNP